MDIDNYISVIKCYDQVYRFPNTPSGRLEISSFIASEYGLNDMQGLVINNVIPWLELNDGGEMKLIHDGVEFFIVWDVKRCDRKIIRCPSYDPVYGLCLDTGYFKDVGDVGDGVCGTCEGLGGKDMNGKRNIHAYEECDCEDNCDGSCGTRYVKYLKYE